MKSGLNVNDLASQIVSDSAQLKDYMGDTRFMRMSTPDSFILRNGSELELAPTELFHQQVADCILRLAKLYPSYIKQITRGGSEYSIQLSF